MKVRFRNDGVFAGVVATAAMIVGVLVGCHSQTSPVPKAETLPASSTSTTMTGGDLGYVGWSVCSECHANRVDVFQDTRHFLALQRPDQVKLHRGFHGGETSSYTPPGSPVRFEMTNDPVATISAIPLAQGTGPKVVSPVECIYGAGAGTDEVYFTRKGEEVFELPIVWLHPQDQWGATRFDPHGSGDLSRPLPPQCLNCHAVWVDFKRGSLNSYGPFENKLLGVTCERCHGPAREHVEHHRAHPLEKVAAHIVQPRQLSRERLMDVCAQCHTNAVHFRQPPFSYRPGEVLDDYFRILEMKLPEEDRVANQVRYLKESRCYQQSETMTCITCHNPHRKTPKDDFEASSHSCKSCHQPSACGEQTRLPQELRDHCTSCHMPKRKKVQVNFESSDDLVVIPVPRYEHRIGVYPEATQQVLWEWLGTQEGIESSDRRKEIARSLASHWGKAAQEASRDNRLVVAIDAYRTAIEFGDSSELRQGLADAIDREKQSRQLLFAGGDLKRRQRLKEAVANFEKLLQLQPNLATAHTELGILYAATGRKVDGKWHLRTAMELDPNDIVAPGMLGWLERLEGNMVAAAEYYRRAAEIDPWSVKANQMLGQCLAITGQWQEAVKAWEQALLIDPQQPEVCHALRSILRGNKRGTNVLPMAEKLVKLTDEKNGELLLTLAEIYHDRGEDQFAEKTLIKAEQATPKSEAGIIGQIQLLRSRLHPKDNHAK